MSRSSLGSSTPATALASSGPTWAARLRGSALLAVVVSLATVLPAARAQVLPVQVQASGNTATVQVGAAHAPIADVTLAFDEATGLNPGSLGVSARLVSLSDPALLARLPDVQLAQLDKAFPLLLTIEPPSIGGLAFKRTVRVEVHTHALAYVVGSSFRLFKAPVGGQFRDITDEVAPGSVRARGTTGGFSQFLVLADLRDTDKVVAGKLEALRARVAMLQASERPALDAQLDTVEAALAAADYATANAALDAFRARVAARAGTGIAEEWRAARDRDNHAGELLAGAATLRFSIAFLRDHGL